MKNIFKYLILSVATLTSPAFAATEVIGTKEIDLPGSSGQAQVSTVKVGETLGRPYKVELRVKCSKEKIKRWESVEVVDSEAVCDVKAQSAKLTADGKNISVLIRETDAAAFNEQSKSVDASALGELQPQCQKQAHKFLFSVEKYCLK